ncbi:hypothetical protein LCI18_006612 [Fusarium solani-melongenae]|uniref:Uncharacterized protein n=1 Tax=Fusarium solani subsp. cucurbitae TaxID=2747967 RepID=A0ACD3Z3K8_FUSSC|nr:hypothetical protein LCI18_006612 [Fusarium solani-melongenae]
MAPNIAESQHLLIRDMILTPLNNAGRPKTVTPNMFTALSDELARNPCMRLADMAAFIRKEFNVDVSCFSLSRALRSAEWRKKATRNVAKERNADLRDEHLVFIDESGCHRSIGTKHKGWAPRGVTPVQIKRFHRGRRFQILPAYSQDGMIHFRVFEGSTDSEIFENFVEELLPYCGRWPEPKSQLCDEAGVVLKFMSPYSPDLNPIEEYFGELKTHDFGLFLEECVRTVGEREVSARGHFRRAGISIEEQPS